MVIGCVLNHWQMFFPYRKVALALQSLGFEETCDDDIMTAVRERVKKLCKKNNMLLHVLADSKSELQMCLQHQQENVGVYRFYFLL